LVLDELYETTYNALVDTFSEETTMQHDIGPTVQNILLSIFQVLSNPAWQGIGTILSAISIVVSMLLSRNPSSKDSRTLKKAAAQNKIPTFLSATHLPKSIPLIANSSVISKGVDFSAETLYTIHEPIDKILQRRGRCKWATCLPERL
jgi:hypothetical protein